MEITVNGKAHQMSDTCTMAQLVEHLDLTGKRIAIEHNGDIAPRSQFNNILLADGDQLEIVVAVGGG
ncbi:MAG: sulfur carrier protein ThiS [Sulfuricellaceae bacterium]|nr:sulfur carrier protein ThiS [Sulfuricellaceae bacterium]